MPISIESIRDGDAAQLHDLRQQGFNASAAFDPEVPLPHPERIVAAYDGDRLVGTVVTLGFEMTWNGTLVPCGGVSGVIVRPEVRGLGLARQMLRESFRRMERRGEVLSALYPTTATLYRSEGYEIAGSLQWRKVPLAAIPAAPADGVTWERVEFGDPGLRAVHEAMSARHDGWFHMEASWWARLEALLANETGTNRFAYLGRVDGEVRSAVIHHYSRSDASMYDLDVDLLAGVDGAGVAAALAFLAGHGTTAGAVSTTLPASLLALHVPHLQRSTVTSEWPWMLRLVDVAGAFAARPVSAAVRGAVELRIDDPVIDANRGDFVLEVADGAATLSPGGAGRVEVSAADLAAVYTGADVGLLRADGRLVGATDADADLLTAACATRPTMPFFF